MKTSDFIEMVRSTPAGDLVSFGEPIRVARSTPIREVVAEMKARKRGAALVCDGDRLAGIVTDRDLLRKVYPEGRWDLTAADVMTPNPVTIRAEEPVAEAIRRMARGGYRHLPLVDEAGRPVKVISVRGLVRHIVEHFPTEVFNIPPDPFQVQTAPEGA